MRKGLWLKGMMLGLGLGMVAGAVSAPFLPRQLQRQIRCKGRRAIRLVQAWVPEMKLL